MSAGIAGSALLTVNASAGAEPAWDETLDVGVRSVVVSPPTAPHKPGESQVQDPSRVYYIAYVQKMPSLEKLVKPVDEGAMLAIVENELKRNGFIPVQKGKKPEVVLTIHYGRGIMPNPYFDRSQGLKTEQNSGGFSSGSSSFNPSDGAKSLSEKPTTGAPTTVITGLNSYYFDVKKPGYEAKMQKAQYEKLFIQVLGWAYQPDPHGKAKTLWMTTMVVDDPDHRDLNAIMGEMLAGGAPYFGKLLNEPEVDVYRPMPNANVKVGTPTVVPSKTRTP